MAAHPAHERFAGQLMVALYRCGRQADALEVYRRTREHLDGELGLEPGPELRLLQAGILRQSLPEEAAAPPRRRTASVPAPPTPTVGRAGDLARLRALLVDRATRLVTVVGPGGVGKTRLVTELGRAWPGAEFVSLASVAAAEHVASAIVHALDAPPALELPPEELLARHLKGSERLLILDNFEHVLDAAGLVAGLLAAAPSLQVVTTSREPLRVRGEHTLTLAPLEAVNGNGNGIAAAVELFLHVARAREPGYTPPAGELAEIATVCRRLDGLPLAIELAATRVGPARAARARQRLDDGLDVLGRGPRDAPQRHRTLRATLSWSHDLLDPEEQAAFAAFSVFAGGADLDAAEAITGASADVLEELLDKQLLVRTGSRLGMLETIRLFARERLAATGELADAGRTAPRRALPRARRARRRRPAPHRLAGDRGGAGGGDRQCARRPDLGAARRRCRHRAAPRRRHR